MLLNLILKPIRWSLSKVIVIVERATLPRAMVREPARQAEVDAECATLALYQFVGCPFCVKVRRQIRRLGLKIELRDAQKDPLHRDALLKGGGELQVPCLRIAEADGVRWLYESSEINAWLVSRFGAGVAVRP